MAFGNVSGRYLVQAQHMAKVERAVRWASERPVDRRATAKKGAPLRLVLLEAGCSSN